MCAILPPQIHKPLTQRTQREARKDHGDFCVCGEIVAACASTKNPASDPSRSLRAREVSYTGVEKVLFVIPSEARDLLFSSASKKQQIPWANPALRNDMVRIFPQPE
jgi:hypothetical protein